jgi:hypothetical protein
VPNSRQLPRRVPAAQQRGGYDAWSNACLRGDLKTDLGYTSQREDASINTLFYRARFYAPYDPQTAVPETRFGD